MTWKTVTSTRKIHNGKLEHTCRPSGGPGSFAEPYQRMVLSDASENALPSLQAPWVCNFYCVRYGKLRAGVCCVQA